MVVPPDEYAWQARKQRGESMLIYSSASSSIFTNDDKIIECGNSHWMRFKVIEERKELEKINV